MFKGIYFNYCLLYRLIMSKNLKIFLGISYLLILFVFLYFIFTGIQVNRLDDFSYYKELQADLDFYISTNILINLFYFRICNYLGSSSRLRVTYTNFFRIIFGQWVGTIISVVSISIGSLVLFIIGNFFFMI